MYDKKINASGTAQFTTVGMGDCDENKQEHSQKPKPYGASRPKPRSF